MSIAPALASLRLVTGALLSIACCDLAFGQADYSTARGLWRGPVQFQFSDGGKRDAAAHAIQQMVIEVRPDGEVRGVINEVNCRISGLATTFVGPTSVRLDLTLKGCADTRFDTRYQGHLSVSGKEVQFRLEALITPSLGKMQQASLSAVLHR